MWLTWLFVAGLAAAGGAPLQRSLTDQVESALGSVERPTDPGVCVGRMVPGEFSVCIQGPEQRIALAAAVAKQARRRLRSAYVSAELKAREWSVVVRPNAPALVDGRPVRTPLAQEVSVQVHDHPEQAVLPLKTVPLPVEWGNAIGVTLKGQGLTAMFHIPMLPEGDLDIVIVTAGRTERRYAVPRSTRAQIR